MVVATALAGLNVLSAVAIIASNASGLLVWIALANAFVAGALVEVAGKQAHR